MKKIFAILPVIVIGVICLPLSCSKDISGSTDNLPALAPAKTDIDAGSWKPVLLTSATEFPVPAPIATTTPDYISQLSEIKSFQNDLTSEEKDLVKYWSAG